MLKELTSLWDYFHKCEQDKAYEEVAIRGYKSDSYNPPPYNFEMAKVWLDKWVVDSVRAGYEDTCIGMVNYLNRQIRQINNDAYKAEIARQAQEFEARRTGRTIQEAIEAARQQAQATGRPVITAYQTPPQTTDWITFTPNVTNTPFATQYARVTINPANYQTITIDNTGAHANTLHPNPNEPTPPPPEALAPTPPTENLWGDIPDPPGGNPPAENNPFTPPNRPLRPGDMTEYGWYDQEIENEIAVIMAANGIAREDAIIRVFNDAGPDHILRNPPPPDPPLRNEPQWADLGDDFNLDEIIIDYPEDDPREDR